MVSLLHPHISFIILLNQIGDNSHYKNFTSSITRNRRKKGLTLPISIGMTYKRSYELRQLGYIDTEQAKVFPSYALLKLTEKAKKLLKTLPIIQTISRIFGDLLRKKQNRKSNMRNPKKEKQTYLDSFIDTERPP